MNFITWMSSKKLPFPLRLPEELIELIKKEAREVSPPGYEITPAEVVIKILREHFDKASKPKEKKK